MQPSALITGGAKRLGAVLSRYLASQGYHLWIHYHQSQKAAQTLQDELQKQYPQQHFHLLFADLSQLSFEYFSESLGSHPLDLLVHNASVFFATPLAQLTPKDWDACFHLHARAPLFLTQALLPQLRLASFPSVIMIGDIQADSSFPLKNYSVYGASKASLLYLVRELALELAPQIRVNAVCPGITLWPEQEKEERQQKLIDRIPLKRLSPPEEIAKAVHFLAQQHAMTGVILPVDGGRSFARADSRLP
jgi:pteridine reductase